MHQPLPLMAAGLPAAAAAAAPGIMGLPANNSPAKGEYLQSHQNASLMSSLDSFHSIFVFEVATTIRQISILFLEKDKSEIFEMIKAITLKLPLNIVLTGTTKEKR